MGSPLNTMKKLCLFCIFAIHDSSYGCVAFGSNEECGYSCSVNIFSPIYVMNRMLECVQNIIYGNPVMHPLFSTRFFLLKINAYGKMYSSLALPFQFKFIAWILNVQHCSMFMLNIFNVQCSRSWKLNIFQFSVLSTIVLCKHLH